MQLYLSLRSLVLEAQTAPSPTGTEVQVKRMLGRPFGPKERYMRFKGKRYEKTNNEYRREEKSITKRE